jgi:hypothetical protein
MINITGKIKRQRYWRELTILMKSLEPPFAKKLNKLISAQFISASNNINNINSSIAKQTKKLEKAYTEQYYRVGFVFGKKTFDAIEDTQKSNNNYEKKQDFAQLVEEMNNKYFKLLEEFIEENVAKRITKINNTTKKTIQRIIDNGFNEGLSNTEIAKEIRKVNEISTLARAKRISRNETHIVANKSMDLTVEVTKIKMEKEWLAALDERTRPAHVTADGQRVPRKDTFTVDGESLEYPGDPNASGTNTILCRCVVIYHTVKKQAKLFAIHNRKTMRVRRAA